MPRMSEQQPRQKVNIDRLSRRMGKYALVVAVAQRSRELKDQSYRRGERDQSSLIGRAISELYEGKVKLIEEDEE
jgi:DNA-directed RNA polymerase subunit K/omega